MPGEARLEARVTRTVRDLVQRAADLESRSVTDFITTAVTAAAHKSIEEATVIRLSVEESRRFAEALIHPRRPNAALRKAFERRRELITSSEGLADGPNHRVR